VSLSGVTIYTTTSTTGDSNGASATYVGPVVGTPVVPAANVQTLQFDFTCTNSGGAASSGYIFLDDVSFVSN
jgi:hypothetical protein